MTIKEFQQLLRDKTSHLTETSKSEKEINHELNPKEETENKGEEKKPTKITVRFIKKVNK